MCAAAGRKVFSDYFFSFFFNWLWEAENVCYSQTKLFLHTEPRQKLGTRTGSNSVSIFLPVSLTSWWWWPENRALPSEPACSASQPGMLGATLRCSPWWTWTSSRGSDHIRPVCRCSLTDPSFQQITTCSRLHPVITHIHKSQWATNLRLPAVLHCVPANGTVLLLTLTSMYRCQDPFMETQFLLLSSIFDLFPLSALHPVLRFWVL